MNRERQAPNGGETPDGGEVQEARYRRRRRRRRRMSFERSFPNGIIVYRRNAPS